MKRPSFIIGTVAKAFRLLEIMSTENELSVSEISRKMNFRRSMGYRILATLKELGYLKQNPLNKKYSISLKLFELANPIVREKSLFERARPILQSLAKETGETVNLGILEGNEVVCIDKVLTNKPLKIDQPIGGRADAHGTAFGKAILAFLPEERIKEIYCKFPLRGYTENTITNFGRLLKELKRIRDRGYSTDNEEFYLGIRCVGAPILDNNGNVIAAISISGPAIRVRQRDFKKLGSLIRQAAASISPKE